MRVRRDDLVTFQVDGTHGSAVAGLTRCFTQHRVNTPRPVWNPDEPQTMDFLAQWEEVPDNHPYDNGFKLQWEEFIRHVVDDAPWKHDLVEGAKGVQLAELGLKSWAERRWLDVPKLAFDGVTMATISLPTRGRTASSLTRTGEPIDLAGASGATESSTASPIAAAHVVADPLADNDPWLEPAIDWDKTIAFREYLWDLGLGVAEAMDTAQRGMGLDWPAREN